MTNSKNTVKVLERYILMNSDLTDTGAIVSSPIHGDYKIYDPYEYTFDLPPPSETVINWSSATFVSLDLYYNMFDATEVKSVYRLNDLYKGVFSLCCDQVPNKSKIVALTNDIHQFYFKYDLPQSNSNYPIKTYITRPDAKFNTEDLTPIPLSTPEEEEEDEEGPHLMKPLRAVPAPTKYTKLSLIDIAGYMYNGSDLSESEGLITDHFSLIATVEWQGEKRTGYSNQNQ
jgi:hypothetical protein